jgi:acetyl-CoA carboxylase carboxyl transferase subunit alpha
MHFLEFEKPLEALYLELEKLQEVGQKSHVDISSTEKELLKKIEKTKKELYANLSDWQRVQLSRHPNRPYTLDYIEKIFSKFEELHGDRNVRDDKAIVGGFAMLNNESVMVIGHQKGANTKMRQMRNFGMANPEGYRKALRLMKMAEKFNKPIITFIDTPGAFPGLEAEERGQGEAIARNLFEMVNLKVPVICIIIGEGASGGALGIGIGDRVVMLENTWYSVISPESCSSILWRTWDFKEKAAEELKLTPKHMKKFGLVDDIIPEPSGGAHSNPNEMAELLKEYIEKTLNELRPLDPQTRIDERIAKFSNMGFYDEVAR